MLQAYNVNDQSPQAPRQVEAKAAKDELCETNMERLKWSDGCVIALKDGRYAIALSFPTEAFAQKYIRRHLEMAERPDLLISFVRSTGRTIRISVIPLVMGQVIPFPTGGVAN